MSFRYHNTTAVIDDPGHKKELVCNERYHVPSEITWLLKSAGLALVEVFGAKPGAFSRNDRVSTDDFEMPVLATRG